MIRKQIEELRTSAMGNSHDVRSLIDTLMLQLEWMKRREDQNADRGQVADGTRLSDPLPPEMPLASNIQSSSLQVMQLTRGKLACVRRAASGEQRAAIGEQRFYLSSTFLKKNAPYNRG
ncbi:hypothetical protein KC19_VG292200 [Ceratodon purpureus]|uniref:Uncharacterized protein n=1 Tax=Ceratodon purpureus TaxID=3225 RepID=A0A8T0HVH9_CERPU|nr:hypothetical protein KC19_VG292200 [Ceratodon purpureus]